MVGASLASRLAPKTQPSNRYHARQRLAHIHAQGCVKRAGFGAKTEKKDRPQRIQRLNVSSARLSPMLCCSTPSSDTNDTPEVVPCVSLRAERMRSMCGVVFLAAKICTDRRPRSSFPVDDEPVISDGNGRKQLAKLIIIREAITVTKRVFQLRCSPFVSDNHESAPHTFRKSSCSPLIVLVSEQFACFGAKSAAAVLTIMMKAALNSIVCREQQLRSTRQQLRN